VLWPLRPPARLDGGHGGRVPLLFSDGGDIIYHDPHIFVLYVLYLKRFQNKSDICHVLCEELFIRPGGQNLAKGGPLATVGMALANIPKKLRNDSESGSRGSL